MHLTAMLSRMASGIYYSAWSKLQLSGYLGRVTSALSAGFGCGCHLFSSWGHFRVQPFARHIREIEYRGGCDLIGYGFIRSDL